MPKPFKGGSKWALLHRGGLEQRNKCVAAIGAIALEWAKAEQMLTILFADLIMSSTESSARHYSIAEAFDMIPSVPAKIKILKRAAKPYDLSKQERQAFTKLLKALHGSGLERNSIAHGNWRAYAEHPNELVFAPGFGFMDERQVYSEDDLLAIVDKIDRAHINMWNFYRDVLQPKIEAVAALNKLILERALRPQQDQEKT